MLQHLVTEAELSGLAGRLDLSAPRRLFFRGFRVSGQARLRTPSGRGRSAAEVSEMITLKHLVLGAGAFRTRPGPYLESWPKIVLFVVVVAVLGGSCRDMEPLSLPPLAQQ
jgi:hypothetical protein